MSAGKLRNTLDDSCSAHSTADAHRDHAVARVTARQFAHDASGEFRPRAAQWMPECYGPAIRIYLVWVESGLSDHRQRLCGERFIQFDNGNVFQLQPGKLQRFWNGVHRADAEFLRW